MKIAVDRSSFLIFLRALKSFCSIAPFYVKGNVLSVSVFDAPHYRACVGRLQVNLEGGRPLEFAVEVKPLIQIVEALQGRRAEFMVGDGYVTFKNKNDTFSSIHRIKTHDEKELERIKYQHNPAYTTTALALNMQKKTLTQILSYGGKLISFIAKNKTLTVTLQCDVKTSMFMLRNAKVITKKPTASMPYSTRLLKETLEPLQPEASLTLAFGDDTPLEISHPLQGGKLTYIIAPTQIENEEQ